MMVSTLEMAGDECIDILNLASSMHIVGCLRHVPIVALEHPQDPEQGGLNGVAQGV